MFMYMCMYMYMCIYIYVHKEFLGNVGAFVHLISNFGDLEKPQLIPV